MLAFWKICPFSWTPHQIVFYYCYGDYAGNRESNGYVMRGSKSHISIISLNAFFNFQLIETSFCTVNLVLGALSGLVYLYASEKNRNAFSALSRRKSDIALRISKIPSPEQNDKQDLFCL